MHSTIVQGWNPVGPLIVYPAVGWTKQKPFGDSKIDNKQLKTLKYQMASETKLNRASATTAIVNLTITWFI
jgi:hypothetical protein